MRRSGWRRLLRSILDRLAEIRERHLVAEDPYDRRANHPVYAGLWEGESRAYYRDGQADVHVTEGDVRDMARLYLAMIARPAPRERLTCTR